MFNFSTTVLCKVMALMTWQDLYVPSENEGHGDKKKNLVQCELVGCQEDAVQLKSWLAEEVHVCPECRARTLLGKGQVKLLHVSKDLKIQLCMVRCGKDVLKSWSVKIRMDVVTLLIGLEWGLLCCTLLIRMQDQDALKPAGLDQNKTSSIFRGKSYSVSDTPETARGEPEGDKIAVFLWPVSSAGLQGYRLGPFA